MPARRKYRQSHAPKKMLKMQVDPQNLLKTKGRKIRQSGDPQNSLKIQELT
jgi:hypothetical protein